MRTKTPTTTEIVARHVLGRRTDQLAVDWAVDLLVREYDSPALRQLAGESEPFEYFQMRTLLNRVFRQLKIETTGSKKDARILLASARIRQLLEKESSTNETLKTLSEIYDEGDGPEELTVFYMLKIVEEGIVLGEDPVYWKHYRPGATLENIDQIVIDQCREWLAEHGTSVELPEPGEQ